MRHIVFEPHADDAFLCLGGHIESWVKQGDDVLIVTVYSGTRKRARDAKDYADAVGADWSGLGMVEMETPASAFDMFNNFMILHSNRQHDRVYAPLGIRHPEHKLVNGWVHNGHWSSRFRYYLDQPYASMPINHGDTLTALIGARVVSYMKPNARKYRHIPLFKDQAKFFHFNPAEKLSGNIELIVSDVVLR